MTLLNVTVALLGKSQLQTAKMHQNARNISQNIQQSCGKSKSTCMLLKL